MNHLNATKRFLEIFAVGSSGLNRCLKAGRGKDAIPREVLNDTLTDWGKRSLEILNLRLTQTGTPSQTPTLFVGNHVSYLDIPVLMSQVPLMFVAKKEVGSWPVFGTAVRKLGMVLVDRDRSDSRLKAAEAVGECIVKRKQSVAIFPSGTTSLEEAKPWRWGAFVIAKRYGIPIQPFRLRYHPARPAAYLMEDVFVPHLWKLLGLKELEVFVEFHPPIRVSDPEKDCAQWWEWSRAFSLLSPQKSS